MPKSTSNLRENGRCSRQMFGFWHISTLIAIELRRLDTLLEKRETS